jgi:hypothetical protein
MTKHELKLIWNIKQERFWDRPAKLTPEPLNGGA